MPIDDWLDMMPTTVTQRPFLERDSYGKPTYGTDNTYSARIIEKQVMFRGSQGQEINADGAIIINGSPALTPADQFELPDGRTPVVIFIKRAYDENGPHHTRIFFANAKP